MENFKTSVIWYILTVKCMGSAGIIECDFWHYSSKPHMCSKFIVEHLQCKGCFFLQWLGLGLRGRASKAIALQQPLFAHWQLESRVLSPRFGGHWTQEQSAEACFLQSVGERRLVLQPVRLYTNRQLNSSPQSFRLSPCANLYFADCHSALLKPILPGTLWLGPSLLDQFALKLPLVWVSCSTASFLDISDMYPRHLLLVFNPFTRMGSCWPPAMSLQEQLQLTRLLITVSTLSSSFQALVYHFPGICNS